MTIGNPECPHRLPNSGSPLRWTWIVTLVLCLLVATIGCHARFEFLEIPATQVPGSIRVAKPVSELADITWRVAQKLGDGWLVAYTYRQRPASGPVPATDNAYALNWVELDSDGKLVWDCGWRQGSLPVAPSTLSFAYRMFFREDTEGDVFAWQYCGGVVLDAEVNKVLGRLSNGAVVECRPENGFWVLFYTCPAGEDPGKWQLIECLDGSGAVRERADLR